MKKTQSFMLFITTFVLALVALLTNGCNGVFLNESNAASEILKSQVRIGIHSDLKKKSIDKDLILTFLKDYKLKYTITFFDSYDQLIESFNDNKIDLIVARNSANQKQAPAVIGPIYDNLQLSLFCRSKKIDQIYYPKKFSELKSIKKMVADLPSVGFDIPLNEIIDKAQKQKNTCFIAERKNTRNLSVTGQQFKIFSDASDQHPVAWLIQKNQKSLGKLAHIWFKKISHDDLVGKLWDQYEAPKFQMSLLEYRQFKKDIQEILPKWKKTFQKNARQYDIPWTLIAAVAYQESKWNAEAKSYTGVKGFMQLTQKTAEHLGVEDREDPYQSIQGGSMYLQYLYDKSPTELSSYDKWIQALAAYNIGWAHLRDIHRYARAQGIDAYRWSNLKMLLPLKEQRDFSQHFNYGLARGSETVHFIDSVLNYYQILDYHYSKKINLASIRQSPISRDF